MFLGFHLHIIINIYIGAHETKALTSHNSIPVLLCDISMTAGLLLLLHDIILSILSDVIGLSVSIGISMPVKLMC